MDQNDWWRRAVVYQVYIRSFADGNGDGTGDLAGLRGRIDYLCQLGVDALWINPWYTSPLSDGGYDVADYLEINPLFGTLVEAEAFISEAQAAGLRVIIDLVPNHTSKEHHWFAEAVRDPNSPARQRYIFAEGRSHDGQEPPNNWRSVFGGEAWTQLEDGQWYLHLFDSDQPDLNWEHPEVRQYFLDVLRFWLDRGVDGFRIDVAHGLVKDPSYRDVGSGDPFAHTVKLMDHPHWDRDELHEIIRSWRAVLDEYPAKMMVAEAWVHPERLPLYLRPDEYHQSFNFELLETPWDAGAFADVIERSAAAAAAVGASSTWVLSNHDVVRHATRYGLDDAAQWRRWLRSESPELPDNERGQRRARAAALITLALPGSAYIYQGEELGLYEVIDLPDEVRDDPVWRRTNHRDRGRDGCRVPIPWTPDGPSFGFGSGAAWLPQPEWFGPMSAAVQQSDPSSMFNLYRQALVVRHRYLCDDEDIEMLDLGGAEVLAFRRGSGLVCIANMGTATLDLPAAEVLLVSGPLTGGGLPADTAVWLRL